MSEGWKQGEAEALTAKAKVLIESEKREAAGFALEHALELWPECSQAREALTALDAGAEWAQVAKPLGSLLLASGVLGGVAAMVSGYVTRVHPHLATPTNKLGGWCAILVLIAIVGVVSFRRAELPERLVSTQTLGVWGFVGLAGALTQVIGYMLHLGPYALIPVTSLLIGIGFATLAFQAGRWLMAPALACFAAGVVLAAFPQFSREILGGMLIVAMGGSGLALRLGAPLR
jgi:hypothetical protein